MNRRNILALGADIKSRFLVAKGKDLRFGPDISDLGDAGNFELFKKKVYKATKNIRPDIVACDLHPGYFSSRFAKENSFRLRQGFGGQVQLKASPFAKASGDKYSLKPVQHHHAHIASVIEEHGLKKPVIGAAFDGTGFGTDTNTWGGEFLMVNKKGFKRLAHLKYMKMPGGDKVVAEPWRMILSILGRRGICFIKGVKKENMELVLSMYEKNINSPLTSSAGRLFDGAAALLGICQRASYEADGPIKLEKMCKEGIEEAYEFKLSKKDGSYIIDTESLFLSMVI